MNVALLGTGKMGAAIARRLAGTGFEPVLWNRTPDRARAVGVGRVAGTAAAAAESADVVLSILYDAASLREVYAGLRAREGQVFVEMSTAGADVPDELAAMVEPAGAELLAAPILGSIPAIERATALILVGGGPAALERVRPVLAAFGQPEHAGTRREAAALKLVSNAMLHVSTVAAAELMAAGRRAGLDPAAVFRLLCRTMPYLEARSRGYLARSHDRPMFELSGAVKDQGLALELGRAGGAAMPLLALSRELFAMAEPEHGSEEMTAVIERYP
ncbi:MAG TPA: NAD(P)-dependent oxidoreductase [Candidatus Eisenbacteria bacterium]|nr:NAD(P)-dependent oxidoreductase [Candidatus Eisenbacteria bacterium]